MFKPNSIRGLKELKVERDLELQESSSRKVDMNDSSFTEESFQKIGTLSKDNLYHLLAENKEMINCIYNNILSYYYNNI